MNYRMNYLHLLFMAGLTVPPLAAAQTVSALGPPAPATVLAAARGGSAPMTADATLHGAVGGNSANQVVTGANTISASSFAGASGIPIVIQNTGANVLIQNATVIQLQFK